MSSSVRVREVEVIEARFRCAVYVSVQKVLSSRSSGVPRFFACEAEGDSVVIGGHERIRRFLLALGKRLELNGDYVVALVARDSRPDGMGGREDCFFEIGEYFENGVPLCDVESVMLIES